MNKQLLILYLILVLMGCDSNDKFVRKSISDENIEIEWYFYSLISDVSPDYVEVTFNHKKWILFEGKDVITNVLMADSILTIQLYKPNRGIVYTKDVPDKIGQYRIIVDSLATRDDYLGRPEGKRK